MTLCLAIESSCDDTSVAIVDDQRRIHANVVRSQIKAHAPYGGVVPEIAARNHIAAMEPVLEAALAEAKVSLNDIDVFAATAGPGLIGGVIVGLMTAKTLAAVYQKPLLGINHLEGHALTIRLTDGLAYPYLLLLTSGGHCFYCHVRGLGDYTLLGGTIDDALGEAFDKCAKMMGLGYPGGPVIERLAATGNPHAYDLPRPLLDRPGCDLSFSGLKTAIRYSLQAQEVTETVKADMAASFQRTACDILEHKTRKAYEMVGASLPIVLAGGVAANQAIRRRMESLATELGTFCVFPPIQLCTDNAAMIAWAALERFAAGETTELTMEPRARWPLAELQPIPA